MTTQYVDFGYNNASSDHEAAKIVILFLDTHSVANIGLLPGPSAVLDASRYIELFEMQIGSSPLDYGVAAQLIDYSEGIEPLKKALQEIKIAGQTPIVLGPNRQFSDQLCNAPTVAFWGKIGRAEVEEAELFKKNTTVLAGIRAAGAAAFQSVPSTVTILTCENLKIQHDLLTTAIKNIHEPIHLSIDLDVLSPAVAQNSRSVEPGGFDWYELVKLLEIVMSGPGICSVEITGAQSVQPKSAAATLCSQILLRLAGLIALAKLSES